MTADPGKSPSRCGTPEGVEGDETAENTERELDDAPTRVRVVLILRRAGKVLAAPASPDGAELVLPSHEVRAGQSIAASAKAIAAELLDRQLGGGALRGLCLVSPDGDGMDAVELCVAAKLDEALPDESVVAREPWAFHPEREATWSAGAARALAFPAGAFTAVDLDGAALPVGGLSASSEPVPAYPPPLTQAASPSRETYILGLGITGGIAWVSGMIWALAAADALKSEVAVVLWVSLLVGVFAVAAHGRQPRRVALGGVLVLPFGFVMFVLAMMFGGTDAEHVAFWIWLFGIGSLGLASRRLASAALTEQQRVQRRWLWTLAALVSLVVVFPPLRDSIFKRGDPDAPEESAQTPRPPADD